LAASLSTIQREEEQAGFTRSHGFGGLLEAGNCATGSTPETDAVHATAHQQRLDAIRKACWCCYCPARRACEEPSRYRALKDIAARS
jgi:hypothetical protein